MAILRDLESGKTVAEVCWRAGIGSASYYGWKGQYAEMGLEELQELKQLREENSWLQQLVAGLGPDGQILQAIVKKKL